MKIDRELLIDTIDNIDSARAWLSSLKNDYISYKDEESRISIDALLYKLNDNSNKLEKVLDKG